VNGSGPTTRTETQPVPSPERVEEPVVTPRPRRSKVARKTALYLASIAACVAIYLFIRHIGLGLVAPAGVSAASSATSLDGPHGDSLGRTLLALLLITLVARLFGRLFQKFGQPPVIGEIVAGIMMGPSLLGRIAPHATASLLTPAVVSFLGTWSQIGAVLFMFLVGMHLDPGQLRRHASRTIAISQAGIIVPFLLGSSLALLLYPVLATSDVPFTGFSLFLGVSMSVTAFPVLARILTDRNAHTSPIGILALACAAVDDLTAWCLLACVIGLVRAQGSAGLETLLLAVGFVVVILWIARPMMARIARHTEERGHLGIHVITVVLLAVLASAAATDAIGIHPLIGAFALGAVIPSKSLLARAFIDKLQDVVVILFLPVYFAVTGLRTEIGLVTTAQQWLLCGLIVLVASLGKFGGVTAVARSTGLSWRASAALGILMNTRGLMELVVLNIGYDMGLISPTLFAMLVLMAVVTTLATTPIFHLLTRVKPIGDALEHERWSPSREPMRKAQQ
jgi:Kef-type K+ transport system membrane component KefB